MAHAEGVVLALCPFRERRYSAPLADRMHRVPAAGENLMRISLVTHVPDDTVFGRVEKIVERDGELDGAQPRGEMPSGAGNAVNQVTAQFRRNCFELRLRELAQIRGAVDSLQ